MRVQPRRELLAIWESMGKWLVQRRNAEDPEQRQVWCWDGQLGRNSISDAELLMCLLLPSTALDALRFDHPDRTHPEVQLALATLGPGPVDIPRRVVALINDYFQTYTTEDGSPTFGGGSYFGSATGAEQIRPEQRGLDVVDSFATSVVLTNAVIRFLRTYRGTTQRASVLAEIQKAERAASLRLTAALAGLIRSFAVNVFPAESVAGRALCRTVSGRDEADAQVVADIRRQLRPVVDGLRELGLFTDDQVAEFDDREDQLFECGWSWGIVRGSQPVGRIEGLFTQPEGWAEDAPYLYFTVVAADGIRDMFTSRARVAALLNPEQQRLARTLNLQLDVSQRYWASIACFERRPFWPLEEIPWRTTDNDETDYYTLMVISLVLNDLLSKGAPDADLDRVAALLEALADRARITRRPMLDDGGPALHHPGRWISLNGSEGTSGDAPRLTWRLADVATLVFGRALAVAQSAHDTRLRSRALAMVDAAWRHVELRRINRGPAAGLWDRPDHVFTFEVPPDNADHPSWYHTTRVVQCLDDAGELIQAPVLASRRRLGEVADDLLLEAEHRFDQELLKGGGAGLRDTYRQLETSLRRARMVKAQQPGSAIGLLTEVLRELDRFAAGRDIAAGDS